MSQPIKIDIWSDVACPWCYLGKHRFERALAEFNERPDAPKVEVEYHSFQLSPELPNDFTGSHGEYLATQLGWGPEQIAAADRQMQTLGAEYGLDYNFDINKIANTQKAHELLHLAKAAGSQLAVKEALFKAHFSDGRDIGRIEELADIAEQAGLDRDDAIRALETGRYSQAVETDKETAARYGISGVPFFVLGGKSGISGAQDPKTFLGALEQISQKLESA